MSESPKQPADDFPADPQRAGVDARTKGASSTSTGAPQGAPENAGLTPVSPARLQTGSADTALRPPRQDPAHPEFWESRYREGVMPWDQGAVPPDFRAWLDQQPRALQVLVPGCGSAYEVAALARAGHEVLAIDYSAAAVARARVVLGEHADCVREADFFAATIEIRWPVVYERAFLCALPPKLWPAYARRMGELVPPGGILLGYFFVDAETGRGPPFPIADEHLRDLLNPWFKLEIDRLSAGSLPVFRGAERWQVWKRQVES